MLTLMLFALCVAASHAPAYHPPPSLREQAAIQDQWLEKRLAGIPDLLKKYDVDAWLISQREHAEETVFWSLKSAKTFAARRRTTYLFHTKDTLPNPYFWIDNTSGVWNNLEQALDDINPRTIAVDVNATVVFGGGMHAGELGEVSQALGTRMTRLVSKPMLAVEFVATRLPEHLRVYRKMQETAWAMVSEAFSSAVITPGITTTEDMAWWYRDKMQALNYSTWNHPTVSVIGTSSGPRSRVDDDGTVIREGDVLHVDFGLTATGLNTDTQHLGYVLRASEGETEVPKGLQAALATGNRLQDIALENMQPGLTGNEVLALCNAQMAKESLDGQIYSHPIGDWGHDAGSLIGMTNLPEHVPILGDLPILPNTYYSIELRANAYVPERDETIPIMLEEDAYWDEETRRWRFVYARQTEFHLVRPKSSVLLSQV